MWTWAVRHDRDGCKYVVFCSQSYWSVILEMIGGFLINVPFMYRVANAMLNFAERGEYVIYEVGMTTGMAEAMKDELAVTQEDLDCLDE